MQMKPIYLFRVSTTEKVFVIYRLSTRSPQPIKVMATGIAYDNHGNYSTKFINAAKKYNIDISENRKLVTWDTADDFEDFCQCVYLSKEITLPQSINNILEYIYDNSEKTVKRRKIMKLIKENRDNKELVDKLYDILI